MRSKEVTEAILRAISHRIVRENQLKEVTLDQRPQSYEGVSHGKNIPVARSSKWKGPEVE